MNQKLKREYLQFRLLIKSVPSWVLIMFVLSVFSMNLLANKSIDLPFNWLALDCGIIVSWFSFLSMDMITKHFGPKAASEISIFAIFINLFMCFVFHCGSDIPGSWGEAYAFYGSEDVVNSALDATFGGTWYVLAGSSFAFILSSLVNNFTNWGIGKAFKKNPDSFSAYAARTYISTSIGQFVDNLVFALTVSHIFFGWNLVQCFTCAITGMAVELLFEVIFSGIGYKTCKKWKESGVGKEYNSVRDRK